MSTKQDSPSTELEATTAPSPTRDRMSTNPTSAQQEASSFEQDKMCTPKTEIGPSPKPSKEQSLLPSDTASNLSCYSYEYPPERECLVVVQVDRVDDSGIWGVLVDWGQNRCTAYLPMGSIGKEKGRGERKAQKHFLTLARRSISKKNDHRMTFVAYVQGIDAKSHSGVADSPGGDIGQQQFHITVTRRGVTEEIEKSSMELSRNIQHCARLLVDKAASKAGVSRHWARKVTMHAAYERALSSSEATDEEREESEPERAPVKFLLKTVGSMEEGAVAVVIDLIPSTPQDSATEAEIKSFAMALLGLCREEKQRRSKPVTFSLTTSIGGPKTALQNKDLLTPTICDTQHLQFAFQALSTITPPRGCEEATATVKGNGKFTLTTTAAPDLETQAREYLDALGSSLQEGWLRSASSTNAPVLHSMKPSASTSNELQPTLSIGVIGDVANGKSTLVKAISGKKTQAHSSEQQQHGITIRLGFANAAVLRCQNKADICGAYSFLPESLDVGKQTSLPRCSKCNHCTAVVKRFSLVDCPGHAELMATMLAGASAFDAVLLAAASNVPCPTPQARQHLEAIKMSGIVDELDQGRNPSIAIAQTKAELLADDSKNAAYRYSAEERLANHAEQGRENMKNSVAAKAPIFPVCAPLGLGLEAIAEWIANLPSTPRQQSAIKAPRLTVLRSFDVNRPGQQAKEVNGGVLGGTIQGSSSISLGDVLEVRPGLCLPSNKKPNPKKTKEAMQAPFKVLPLSFRCTSLMTGKCNLSSVSKGGLVAVGTSLDPLICADNRMVGSVAGPPGTLPPVWGPTLLLDNLQFVDLLPESGVRETKSAEPADLVKKGSEIRFHVGSTTVKGRVVRVSKSKGKVGALLEAPICAARGANVALEGKRATGFCLVAHAKLADGDVCLEGVDEDQMNGDDEAGNDGDYVSKEAEGNPELELLERDEYFRMCFLENLESCKETQADNGGSRLSVPLPDIARDGGAHVVLSNFGAIAHSLRRSAGHLVAFLEKEGGLSCALAGDRTSPATTMLRVKWRGGRGFAERFMAILQKYIRAYVSCNQCRGAVTELLGASKTEQACRHCNARRFVPKL